MPIDPELQPHIDEASRLNNLDPDLLRALIMGESGGNPNATSSAGAGGLTQLMPGSAKGIDPYDPVQAIYRGADILNSNLTKAEQLKAGGRDVNPVEYALKEYFAGPEGQQWGSKTAAYPSYIASFYKSAGKPPPSPQDAPSSGTTSPGIAGGDNGQPFPPSEYSLSGMLPPGWRRQVPGDRHSALVAPRGSFQTGGVTAGPDDAVISKTQAAQMNAADPTAGQHLPVMPTAYIFGKGKAAPPGAGSVTNGASMDGIDQLAAAGQPQPAGDMPPGVMQLAQAGQGGMSDEALLKGFVDGTLPFMQKPPAMADAAPQALPAAAQAPQVVPTQSPQSTAAPALDVPGLIDTYNRYRSFPIGLPLAQGALGMLQKMAPEGYVLGQDGTVSLRPGMAQGANTLKANEAAGTNLETIGPNGAVAPLPGAAQSAQTMANAKAEGEQKAARQTAAEAPRELRGAGTSVLYPPGSVGAQQFIDAQKNGGSLPPGMKINQDGSVEVGNVNVPPETVNERYKELHLLQDEAQSARVAQFEASQLKEKLHQIGTSGPATDYLGKLSALAQQAGLSPEQLKDYKLPAGATVEEANKLSTDLLGSVLKAQFPGRITNTDITAWKNTVPRATTLQEANDFLIDKILMPKFQRSVDRYGFAAGLSSTDPQLTTYYKALNDWDNQHPFDAYQVASQFKPSAAQSAPDPAMIEQEMRRRGLLR